MIKIFLQTTQLISLVVFNWQISRGGNCLLLPVTGHAHAMYIKTVIQYFVIFFKFSWMKILIPGGQINVGETSNRPVRSTLTTGYSLVKQTLCFALHFT